MFASTESVRLPLALFESLGGIELVMVGIAALLLFGKDLPKVAADAGAQFTKLRRALDSTWRDSGLEREVRQIREAIPRDLSLREVARSASEKLAVRLEEEERVRNVEDAQSMDHGAGGPAAGGFPAGGPVARGNTIHDPLPEFAPDPRPSGTNAPESVQAPRPERAGDEPPTAPVS